MTTRRHGSGPDGRFTERCKLGGRHQPAADGCSKGDADLETGIRGRLMEGDGRLRREASLKPDNASQRDTDLKTGIRRQLVEGDRRLRWEASLQCPGSGDAVPLVRRGADLHHRVRQVVGLQRSHDTCSPRPHAMPAVLCYACCAMLCHTVQ